MFGSSRVNKSTKKFAPRAPARRNKDTTSSKDAASPAPQSTSNTTPAAVDSRATPGASKPPPDEPSQQENVQDHGGLPEVTEGVRERDKESQDSTGGDTRPQAQTRQGDGVHRQSGDKSTTAEVLPQDIGEVQRDGSELATGQRSGTQVSDVQASKAADNSRKVRGASQEQAGIQETSRTGSSIVDASSVQQLSTPAPTESAISEVVSGDDTAASVAEAEITGETHISTETPLTNEDQATPAVETSSPTESTPADPSRTSRTSKAKRKRTTEGEPATVSTEGVSVAKKPRKVRKDKGTTRKPTEPTVAPTTPATEGDTPGREGDATATSTKRKRASKKRAVSTEQNAEEEEESEAEEDGEEDSQKRKRKRKRKERSPTPEDAEYIEVDEATVTLQDLTADRRQGQVSSRERAMREIDWDEVARRRKERLRDPITNEPKKRTKKAVDEEQDAAEGDGEAEIDEGAEENPEDEDVADEEEEDDDDAPFTSTGGGGGGVTLRMVDGRLVVDETSAHIDRHAAATAPDTLLETVEEDDLTTHITQHSFLHANKRDPADRRPTPNDRWRLDDDDKFYAALGMFGTDFAAIARMFPGRTRRNIKHKFTREERQNPALVRAALVGQVKPELDINAYLRESDRTEDDLLDPRALAAELDALRAEMQPEIDAARKEFTETERQKRIAEGAGLAGREEEGAKKKTRRKKRHEPKGGEEVEIIGTIEDGLWGS